MVDAVRRWYDADERNVVVIHCKVRFRAKDILEPLFLAKLMRLIPCTGRQGAVRLFGPSASAQRTDAALVRQVWLVRPRFPPLAARAPFGSSPLDQ